jgi:hypothetical protein
VEYSKDNKSPSNDDIGYKGNSQGQAHYPEASFQEPERVLIPLAGQFRPGIAQGEGDANQQEKEGGSEAGQIKPESSGQINLMDPEEVQVIRQVEDDHHYNGQSSKKIHLPEADRPAVIHRA